MRILSAVRGRAEDRYARDLALALALDASESGVAEAAVVVPVASSPHVSAERLSEEGTDPSRRGPFCDLASYTAAEEQPSMQAMSFSLSADPELAAALRASLDTTVPIPKVRPPHSRTQPE